MTTTSTRSREGRQAASSSTNSAPAGRLTPLMQRLESPVATYYLLLGSTSLLVAVGLVMVLSASSVRSYMESGSSYTVFLTQLVFAGVGLLGALIASRIPVRGWKLLAPWVFLLAVGLQALVFTQLGVTVNGNRNWVSIAGQSLQPSELGKIAVVVFGAAVLTRKRRQLGRTGHALIPFVLPGAAVFIGLVLAGRDLGTTLVLVAIVGGMLFAAGVRARMFLLVGAVAAAGAAALVITSTNRMGRIETWLGDSCTDAYAEGCYQKVHGEYALADGGWWGVGLGASREKWSWLPEPHNDFIFAIIGEELGMPGTFAVLALFAVLAFACYRLVLQSDDFFVRVATAGVMVWVLVQACVNIGSVIGLLPIVGVPLPLVSSGGSALVTTMVALGLLLSFARNEPECKAALAARPGIVSRTWAALPSRDSGTR